MAEVTVRLYGVLRADMHLACEQIRAEKVSDIFVKLSENRKEPLAFKDALVYINGERCPKKNRPLKDGDEIWLLSPAAGG